MPQQINFPYGNAYIVNTPHIDQLTQQLYTEQKNRELLRQKQAAALDDEFAKNVAGIKDVDVPELTKLYGDWKTANIQLMKNPKGVSPEQQLELLRKKAEMYKFINSSKQDLSDSETLGKEYYKNPDQFDDNTPTYLAVRRKTPTNQLGGYKDASGNPINLQDGNTYKYKGTNTDFSKIERESAGTPRQVYQEESALDGGLQTKITPYMYGNTPTQFYQNYLGALAVRKAGRDAEALASQIKPEMYESVQTEYKAIPVDTWKKMGVDKPQELVINPEDSKAEKLAKHQAQLYALNNQPKEGTPVFRDNKAAITDKNQAFELRKLAIQHSNAADLINKRHELTKGDKALDDVWVSSYLDNLETDAQGNEPTLIEKIFPKQQTPVHEISIDPVMAKALDRTGNGMTPDKLFVSEDGTYYPLYYDDKGNIDKTESVPLSKQQVVLSLGGKTVTKSKIGKEVQSTDVKHPLPKGQPKTVTQGGHTYTWSEEKGTYE